MHKERIAVKISNKKLSNVIILEIRIESASDWCMGPDPMTLPLTLWFERVAIPTKDF